MSLEYELSYIKRRYREIFTGVQQALEIRLNALQDGHQCTQCQQENRGKPELLEPLHADCGYRAWQQQSLFVLEHDVGKSIVEKLEQINVYKKRFTCSQCGVCCRLASSEFSYEQLLEKARNGDNFARHFTSVFLPYASTEAARQKMPDLVNEIMAQFPDSEDGKAAEEEKEKIHFYHCPYVGEDNRCTIYGSAKRPGICESYPDTPLTFIYNQCSWKPWKDATHDDSMAAHATIELATFMAGKLRESLQKS